MIGGGQSGVRYEKKDHVARITLDRPDVLNAMNLRMHEELALVWDDVEADDDIRVAVLTGASERSFTVGQDLRERARLDREGAPRTTFGSRGQPGWPRLTDRFDLSKPVLARVNGYALGGGFELALACDLIVAADHAVFALPEVTLGLVPGAGGAFRLARQLPLKTAMGYVLTGRRMIAAEALRFGLVNEVVPAPGLDPAVDAWTDALLRRHRRARLLGRPAPARGRGIATAAALAAAEWALADVGLYRLVAATRRGEHRLVRGR